MKYELTSEQINFIKEHRYDMNYKQISDHLGIKQSIVAYYVEMNMLPNKTRGRKILLTKEETEFINKNRYSMTYYQIAQHLRLPYNRVNYYIKTYMPADKAPHKTNAGSIRYHLTHEQIAFIDNNVNKMSIRELQEHTKTSQSFMTRYIRKNYPAKQKSALITKNIDFIKANINKMSMSDIATKVGVNEDYLRRKIHAAGIRKMREHTTPSSYLKYYNVEQFCKELIGQDFIYNSRYMTLQGYDLRNDILTLHTDKKTLTMPVSIAKKELGNFLLTER